MVNLLQIIRYMTMFTLFYPKLLLTVWSYITILNFENVIFSTAFLHFVNEGDLAHHKFEEYRFNTLGIRSYSILLNWADLFMYLLIFIVVMSIKLLLTLWTKPKPNLAKTQCWKRIYYKVINGAHSDRTMFSSILIRVGYEIFLDWAFCSVLNIMNMGFKNNSDSLSTVTSLLFIVLLVILSIVIFCVSIFAKKTYDKKAVEKSKIKSLYDDMKSGNKFALSSHTVFIALRVTLISLTLFCRGQGMIQNLSFMVALITVILFKLKVKPFDDKLKNLQDVIGYMLLLTLWVIYFKYLDGDYELCDTPKWRITAYICLTVIAAMVLYFYVFAIIAGINGWIKKRSKSHAKVHSKSTLGKFESIISLI